jgi:hypothetical protein
MAPLPSLPSPQFDLVKVLLKAATKVPVISITGNYHTSGQVIKTSELIFLPGTKLVFDNVDYPFLAIYADRITFNGHFEIDRIINVNLNGPNGANAAPPKPTPPGDGIAGNNGLPGFPGRDGQKGIRMPMIVIIAQETYFGTRPANKIDVDAIFNFDGCPGGNGGSGGIGSNGTDGNRGSPAGDGWFPGDCDHGPGWGGRGGNAGMGGMPGYGGDGGDGPNLYMFVAPDQLPIFQAVAVSQKGGKGGSPGGRGHPGVPGKGGDEGDYSQTTNCYSDGRFGQAGVVPAPCPIPEVRINNGVDGKSVVTDYVGFAELN